MEKVTIITGPQGSGKTAKAWDLIMASPKSALMVDSLAGLKEFDPAIYTLIVFDGIAPSPINLRYLKKMMDSETIDYRKPYEKTPTTTKRPEIIICIQTRYSPKTWFTVADHVTLIHLNDRHEQKTN